MMTRIERYKAGDDHPRGEEKLLQNKNTEDGVVFKGKGCDIPLVYHKYLVNYDWTLYSFSFEERKAKAPPVKHCH